MGSRACPIEETKEGYADELLDAYLRVEDADALYAEYEANGVEFTRELVDTPWNSREFVVKDATAVCWPSARIYSAFPIVWSTKTDCADECLKVGSWELRICHCGWLTSYSSLIFVKEGLTIRSQVMANWAISAGVA
jgi:hypothetical protein